MFNTEELMLLQETIILFLIAAKDNLPEEKANDIYKLEYKISIMGIEQLLNGLKEEEYMFNTEELMLLQETIILFLIAAKDNLPEEKANDIYKLEYKISIMGIEQLLNGLKEVVDND